MTEEAFKKAKEYIIAGGNVDAIQVKYKLNGKQIETLVNLKNEQTEDPYTAS